MLKKETTEKIKALGFDVDKLITAIKSDDEQDYIVPDIVPISPKDLEARDGVKLAEGKKEGEKEARTVLVAEIGKKLGMELKGERVGDLVTELQAAMNKGDNDKIKLLQDQVNALSADKTNLETKIIETEKTAQQIKFDSDLINHFPATRGAGLTDSERLLLIKQSVSFETIDGKTIAKRNGEVVKNPTTHAPLEVAEVIKGIFTEKPLLLGSVTPAAGGGRGGKDNFGGNGGGNGIKNFTQAKEAWKALDPEKNTNPVSQEFTTYVNELAAADKEFDMYN